MSKIITNLRRLRVAMASRIFRIMFSTHANQYLKISWLHMNIISNYWMRLSMIARIIKQALRHFTEQQQSKPRNDTFQCKHLY